MGPVQGLDHVIVLVRDLDAAEESLARLGFKTTPRGFHSEVMGTANATAVFRNETYVELMTVLKETPLSRSLAESQKAREGLAGIALKTSDAHATAAVLQQAGMAAGAPEDLSRPVKLDQGAREARFTIARVDPAKTPAGWMFACQHHTPEIVWRAEYLEHPNSVTGILEVVGVASDLDAIARAYEPIASHGRLRREVDQVVFEVGSTPVTFLEPLAFAARYGRTPRSPLPQLGAISFQVEDLQRVRAVLDEQRVPHIIAEDRRVLVPCEVACGVAIEFVAADV